MDDLNTPSLSRRALLSGSAALALASTLPNRPSQAQAVEAGMRKIPSSGEMIPAVGLGTWITFNVGKDPVLLKRSAQVMQAFFDSGGRVIDSSPMYGSSQDTLGYGLSQLGRPDELFAADKVVAIIGAFLSE
ncbi:aldo/keto reductase [Afifella marina]|uniref:Aldo/keto reductase family protein n=1 Tax=Afifella marina DSM 2698 TaxID=1120955 RepID=A0A1G5M3D2_AFIMA|nr:Aldo/keto reductase family protein [Afifella marina DSM 2698]